MINHVFVYGSLKTKGRLFPQFLAPFSKEFLNGSLKGAKMYDVSNGSYPGALLMQGKQKIFGEVHKIKNIDDALHRMDMVEGYDEKRPIETNHYIRKIVDIETKKGLISAYFYEYNRPVDNKEVINNGFWEV